MVNICEKTECTGCMACVNACINHAISVVSDEEGFDRPLINENLCTDCGRCVVICPMRKEPKAYEAKEVYSGWAINENIRLKSSSGGAFFEIARSVIEEGGIVFGCTLNKHFQAEHICVDSIEDLSKKISGSKYIQSRIGDSFIEAKKKSGKWT